MKEEKVKKTSTKSTKKKEEKKPVKKTAEKKVTKKTTEKPVVKEEKAKTKVVKEKVKKEKVYLDQNDQKKSRAISRVLHVLSKIARIFLMIVVPFIFLAMIVVPFGLNKMEVDGSIIKFDDVHLIAKGDKYVLKVADDTYLSKGTDKEMSRIYNFLHDNSKTYIITSIEIALGFAAAVIIVMIYLFNNLEKLFYNIYSKKTPFNEENCDYIHKICRILIIEAVLVFVASIVLGLLVPSIAEMEVNSVSIFGILVAYLIYYIFKYATEMQKESKTVMFE